jgi:hypothetical protein
MRTLILGERNTSAIGAGNQAQPITITYNFGGQFTFDKFVILYNPAVAFALTRIVNTQANQDFVSFNTPLGSIGSPLQDTANRRIPWIEIEPITIINGQSVQMFINNITAVAIPANELSLTLYGKMTG